MADKSYFDEGWKGIIKTYSPQFFKFFFKEIYNDIDFSVGFKFLDKEFEKIIKRSKEKRRYADLLIEIYLKNGETKWIIIHIEIQGYQDKEFLKRILIYNFKARALYGKVVVSLGILVDDDINFRLNKYEENYWGFKHIFEFPIIKILDYKGKEKKLEKMKNPFADVVLTQLKCIEKGLKIEDKLFWKITLVKRLYRKGHNRDYIINLFKFIDLVINLPKKEEDKFLKEIEKYEEVIKMPLLIPAEKIWMEKGIEKGIEKGMEKGKHDVLIKIVEKRIRRLGKKEKETIMNCNDIAKLDKAIDEAISSDSIEEVLMILK